MQPSASLADLQETFTNLINEGHVVDAYCQPSPKAPKFEELVIVCGRQYPHGAFSLTHLGSDTANKYHSVNPLHPSSNNYMITATGGYPMLKLWPRLKQADTFLRKLEDDLRLAAISRPFLKVDRALSRVDAVPLNTLKKIFTKEDDADEVRLAINELERNARERTTAVQHLMVENSVNTLKDHMREMHTYKLYADSECAKLIDNIEALYVAAGNYYGLAAKSAGAQADMAPARR